MSRSPDASRRANDLSERGWRWRLERFVRARLRGRAQRVQQWADDPRTGAARRRGWDPVHFQRLQRWADEGFRPQVVYDIGANDGSWSEMCQSVFGPRVLALFEPQKHFLAELNRRAAGAQADWRVFNLALGETETTCDLRVAEQRAASSLLPVTEGTPRGIQGGDIVATEAVRVTPLDVLVRQQDLPAPELVKIDVQGFEAQVLAGGRATLGKARRLIVEASLAPVFEGQELLPSILARLTELGFVLDDLTDAYRTWPDGRLWQADLWLQRPAG